MSAEVCDLNLVARVCLSGKTLEEAGAYCDEAQDAVLSAVWDEVGTWYVDEDAIVDWYCEMADTDVCDRRISIEHD